MPMRMCEQSGIILWACATHLSAPLLLQMFREETFGPAIPLFRFSSESEAIQLANDTEYGLASYFFTKVRARGSLGRQFCCLTQTCLYMCFLLHPQHSAKYSLPCARGYPVAIASVWPGSHSALLF